MSWRDKLQPASFRGVPFFVDGDDAGFGRRTQLHEYPQRDKPYNEDLGRAAREFSIAAFVVGKDFMAARDALINALEQGGSGILIHPFYGTCTVSVSELGRVSHRKENGGYCEFQLSFVEAGDLEFPRAAASTQSQSAIAADAVSQGSQADFADNFTVEGYPQYISDESVASLVSAVSIAQRAIGVGQTTSPVPVDWASLAYQPASLATAMTALFETPDIIADGAQGMTAAQQSRYYAAIAYAALDLVDALTNDGSIADTDSRRLIISNSNAVNALLRQQALSQAAGASAQMPITIMDDAVALQTRFGAAADNELWTASDDMVPLLLDLRSAVVSDLMIRAQGSASLITYTPPVSLPAAMIAYDLYEDATRMDEIVARNHIANPLFVFGAIQVLSS